MTGSVFTTWSALSASAAKFSDKVALIDRQQTLTYSAVAGAVTCIAGGFRQIGARHGSVIAVMLDNHVDHVLLWFSTGALGSIEVALNPQVRGQMLLDCLSDSEAEILVIEAGYASEIVDVLKQLPKLRVVVLRTEEGQAVAALDLPAVRCVSWCDLAQSDPICDIGDVDGGDVFSIVYTSGSSGKPKGVLTTHAQTYLRCKPGTPGVPCEDDVTLVTLPMFHVAGLCRGVYSTLINGGTAVLMPRFSASQFWNQARQYSATCAPLLGSTAAFLAAQPPTPDDRNHGIRWVTMSPPITAIEEFRTRFGLEIYNAYGLTEAVALTYGRASGRGTGWLRDDFEMRLVDDRDRTVPAGSPGELIVRAKEPWLTMPGYHNNPKATLKIFRNQWLHTGDIFEVLDDGELRFINRKSDRIRRRGENIAPTAIEDVAGAHEQIEAAFALAVPDDEGVEDEILLCVLRTDPKLEPVAIRAFLSGRIPAFMVPRYIVGLSEIPMTPSQKVDRGALRKRLADAWDANAYPGNQKSRSQK